MQHEQVVSALRKKNNDVTAEMSETIEGLTKAKAKYVLLCSTSRMEMHPYIHL